MQHIVDSAIKTRQMALARKIRLVLAGYADDVRAGRPISKRSTPAE
jgi:hypothetical protein